MTDPDSPLNEPVNAQEKLRYSESKRKTVVVLDAGILPHSTNERDHAYALLGPVYNIQGGKMYAERIARMNVGHIIMDVPPQITHRAQLGLPDPELEARRTAIRDAERAKVMTTVADHMMNYVEDAQMNIDALLALDVATEGFTKTQPLGPLLAGDTRPEIQRAVTVLTRLYETQEYATQPDAKKSRMNTDLIKDIAEEAVQDRIKEATHDLGIGEVRKEIMDAIELEIGRLNFWTDQLIGHPDQPREQAQADESDEFNRPAVRKRYGVVEIDNPTLRNRIFKRLAAIAAGELLEDK
jgi:hypothetical protein